jgi:FkbM family methyltransferase
MGLRRFARNRGYELFAKVIDPEIKTLQLLKELNRKKNQNSTNLSFFNFLLANYSMSNSEHFQDLFVLWALNKKDNGIFIEFGATDGIFGSNSLTLENIGWRGILSEPAKIWKKDLIKNRPNSQIEFNCVWNKSGERLSFSECTESNGLSTLSKFKSSDQHASVRAQSQEYLVETISLNDLIAKYELTNIDYLSIDTEGSEYEILKAWDHAKHPISIITVEHNFIEPRRTEIKELLEKKGFSHFLQKYSYVDDWYLHESINLL